MLAAMIIFTVGHSCLVKTLPSAKDLHDSVLWVFSSLLCWLPPRHSPTICSSNGSAPHCPRDFLGDIMYCMASVTLLQVATRGPNFVESLLT